MNLVKLFETQKVLRDRINYNKSDRFDKLVLALLVELGECANEWRGFKFWSKDNEPRIKKICPVCGGLEEDYRMFTSCGCENGFVPNKNPLLEEYVDGLHFVLELGIELGLENENLGLSAVEGMKRSTISKHFNYLFDKIGDFGSISNKNNYMYVINLYIGLGEMLGFTWEEIEEAYYKKNKINHTRQDTGY